MHQKTVDNLARSKRFLNYVYIGMGLLMLIDFILPSETIETKILSIYEEEQPYYNAAGNSHETYLVETEEESFYIKAPDALQADIDDNIGFDLSPIFREVNNYTINERTSTFSMRTYSGLVFPLIAIFFLVLSFKYSEKLSILTFVIQVVLLVNLYILIK